MATTERPQNSNYNDLTAQNLNTALREKLSFDDDEIQKIMLRLEARATHQEYYQVDEDTYKRVFG
jgi:hypothetical protein